MLETNYLIRGLNEPDIVVSYKGTSHFINSMVPEWYRLDAIELAEGEANLIFHAQKQIPDKLSLKRYVLGVYPHKKFELIAKEVATSSDRKSAVIRYIFLNCKVNRHGKYYFHYDKLEKHVPKEEANTKIALMSNVSDLLDDGFILTDTGDDESTEELTWILNRKKAS